jgi:mono/diheme cytochrome c family protein
VIDARAATVLAVSVSLTCGGCGRHAGVTVANGRALYAENGCANCHGASGHGDGTVGRTLTVPPRDFRDREAFKKGDDVQAIGQTLADGLSRNGSQMPAFAHLSRQERESLALFVISLRDAENKGVVR